MNMLTAEKKLELMKAAGLDTGKLLNLLAKEDPQLLNLSDEELDNVTGGAFIGTVYDPKPVGDAPVCGGIHPTAQQMGIQISIPQGVLTIPQKQANLLLQSFLRSNDMGGSNPRW